MSETVTELRGLVEGVTVLLRHRIGLAAEEVIATAVKDFEKRLRKEIASASMDVANFYELHRERDNLVITVKIPQPEDQPNG